MKRRSFLKASVASSTLVAAASVGLLAPISVFAADWPEAAISANTVDDALNAAFGTSEMTDSDAITIQAPLQAENGAVVPVKITTTLPAEAIAVLAEKNPAPMVSLVQLGSAAGGVYSVRIKMGTTSPVHCVVQSGGKLYKATQEIKVTVGGCGG